VDFLEHSLTVKKGDIEGQGRVRHPETHALWLFVGEEHTGVGRKRLPVHEAQSLFVGQDRDFRHEVNFINAEGQGDLKINKVEGFLIHRRAGRNGEEDKEAVESAQKRREHGKRCRHRTVCANGIFMAKEKKTKGEVLLYASTAKSADMLYFGGVEVPDAFVAFSKGKRKVAIVSQLEYARVGKESQFDEVLLLEECLKAATKAIGVEGTATVRLIRWAAQAFAISSFRVAADFPLSLGRELAAAGLKLEVSAGLLFPEREFKDDAEAAAICQGNAASAAGFKVVEKMLRAATIKGSYLMLEGKRLTSERVQQAIAIACLQRGATASHTIVAGGDQACDPHCRGSGPLKANELIIVDIFPRIDATGYHGDMTRTYLKGRASEAQRKLVHTVLEAEQWALVEHRSGRSGSKIYQAVMDRFIAAGYPTEHRDGTPVGFFHGLGHGLGLEVHEPPRINVAGTRLRKGQVITVEPGLYYPGLGGVRFEDVIRVQSGEPQLLSNHPYRWEIC
jgi:Xaa-Pro aminopeptidase